jgi:hypothetical protein
MYLLDANVFITAARLYYAFDLVPGFWEWLAAQGDAGNIGSIPRVRAELTGSTDPLSDWAKARPDSFWIAESADTVTSAGRLTSWIMGDGLPYTSAAKDEFLASADYMLIAECHASAQPLVTHEKSSPNSRRKVFIPDVCRAHAVQFEDPWNVLRSLGLRLG